MPKNPQRKTLAEFAADNPVHVGQPCWLCAIPEREEVEAAAAAGTPKTVIRRWLLEECGYPEATANRVERHLREHGPKAAR